jgi:hypothetical protein
MKTTIFALLAIIASSSFATSPEPMVISGLKCLKGKLNEAAVKAVVGEVGSLTTEGYLQSLVYGPKGLVKKNHGYINAGDKVTIMLNADGLESSFCATDGAGPTYLVVSAKK